MSFPLSMGAAELPVTMGTGGLEEAEARAIFWKPIAGVFLVTETE